ncbi:MAG: transposase [Desulfosporosinus sp.]|nr:transposase [Desulfosporosinus sp.]MBC2725135.1 transposase [Desulfosporosinus sp.]
MPISFGVQKPISLSYHSHHVNEDGVFDLLGYVIMDNHYHLIIGTKEKSLDKIMQQVNNAYSKGGSHA